MHSWKILLPLSALVSLAWAGGRTLSAQESAQFLSLFRRYCSNPGSPPSQDGNTFYYCKTSDERPQTREITHDAQINPGETPKQVIFVQPPSTNYVHNVALSGSPGNPQQTDIYVLPTSAEHKLQLQDTRSSVQAVKPSLYFLSGDNAGGNGGSQGGNLGNPGGSFGGNRLPPPGITSVSGGSSDRQRPSAPPPGANDPAVIGIGTGLTNEGGYNSGATNSFYGAPSGLLSPRNQRNAQRIYRTL